MIIESLMVDSTEQFSRKVSGARDIFLSTGIIKDAHLFSVEQICSLIAPTSSELWRETLTDIHSKLGGIQDLLISLRERDI